MSFWDGLVKAVTTVYDSVKDAVGFVGDKIEGVVESFQTGVDAVGDFFFGDTVNIHNAPSFYGTDINDVQMIGASFSLNKEGYARDIFRSADEVTSLMDDFTFQSSGVGAFIQDAKRAFTENAGKVVAGAFLQTAGVMVLAKSQGVDMTSDTLKNLVMRSLGSSVEGVAKQYAFNTVKDAFTRTADTATAGQIPGAPSGVTTGDQPGGSGGLLTDLIFGTPGSEKRTGGLLDMGIDFIEGQQTARANEEFKKFETDETIRANNALYAAREQASENLKARFNPQGYNAAKPQSQLPDFAGRNQGIMSRFQGTPEAYQPSAYTPATPQEILERKLGIANLTPQV